MVHWGTIATTCSSWLRRQRLLLILHKTCRSTCHDSPLREIAVVSASMSLSHSFPRYLVLLGTSLLPDWCVHGANRVPRSFWQRGIVALQYIPSTLRSPDLVALSSLGQLPHQLVSFFFRCFGVTFLALLHGPILIFVLKVFGFVKHEGPYHQHVAEWRDVPGVLHRGLHVGLPCVRWSNVFWLSWAPLPFCLHTLRRTALFLLPSSVPTAVFAIVSSLIPSSWPDTAPFRSCLLLPLTRWRLALAQEAARGVFPFVFLDGEVPNRILTGCKEFVFQRLLSQGVLSLRQTCSFHTLHCSVLLTMCILSRSSITYSGYVWIRSNVTTSCTMLHLPDSPHGHNENNSYLLPDLRDVVLRHVM